MYKDLRSSEKQNTHLRDERLGLRHHGVLEDTPGMVELLRGFDQLLQLL